MTKPINQLLASQKEAVTKVRALASDILKIIEGSLSEDDTYLSQLKRMNSKEYDITSTFFKMSCLLLKTFPMEHKILGTKLVKGIEGIEKTSRLDNVKITDTDVEVMRNFVKRYDEKKKNDESPSLDEIEKEVDQEFAHLDDQYED